MSHYVIYILYVLVVVATDNCDSRHAKIQDKKGIPTDQSLFIFAG